MIGKLYVEGYGYCLYEDGESVFALSRYCMCLTWLLQKDWQKCMCMCVAPSETSEMSQCCCMCGQESGMHSFWSCKRTRTCTFSFNHVFAIYNLAIKI